MTQESKNVSLNEILVEIHSELRNWFLVLSILFIVLFAFTTYKDIIAYIEHFNENVNDIAHFDNITSYHLDTPTTVGNTPYKKNESKNLEILGSSTLSSISDVHLGSFNMKAFNFNVYCFFIVTIIIMYILMTYVNGKKRVNQKDENSQMKTFMILSTVLLCIYIYLTGGFLDSPFSSAISIYLSGFLLIQDRDDSKISNIIIIAIAVFFVILPYLVYGYINVDDEIYFFNYSTKDNNVYFRLVITLGLVIYSLYSGQKISNKINKLYGIK
jgi:NADH:ubiquinone oxidoreductase subunit 5 (subunit L)/multisubunit Na+/H+ antiporter MnhA subunit